MAQAGTAYIDFEAGSFAGLHKAIAAQLAPITNRFGKLGKAGVAGLGIVAGAAVGTGTALYRIGEAFDDANDTIRVGTGATGKRLKGLEQVFKNVVKGVPTDFEHASDAVTQINQRLGLTGKPLTKISKQFLELSRLTKTDLSTNIESVTRLFGDWGIQTGKQSGKLDELFRASQKTGVPVSKLSEIMTKFGGPLRQLGFNFDQAAAMAGKFEKEGVNTSLVLGSMRIALGKMAKDGEAPVETLRRVVGEIKNAGSAGEANRKALELFGARAGPDMAAAIREGRFELGNLEKAIKGGGDSIGKASRDTRDLSEKLQVLKNKALVALEPVATRVFNAVGKGLDKLSHINFNAIVAKIRDFLRPLTSEISRIWDNPNLSLGEKLAKSIAAGGSFIADAAAQAFAAAAPHAVRAFVTAFRESNIWGKLFILAMIASKLGLFSTAGGMAASRFAIGFTAGSAKIKAAFVAVMAAASIRGGVAAGAAGAIAGGAWLKAFKFAGPLAVAGIIADALVNADDAGLDPKREREMIDRAKRSEKAYAKVTAAIENVKKSGKGISGVTKLIQQMENQGRITAGTADTLRNKVLNVGSAVGRVSGKKLDVDTSGAQANIDRLRAAVDALGGSIGSALGKLLTLNATPVKHKAGTSSVTQDRAALKFELEDKLRILQQRIDDKQADFDRKDAQRLHSELETAVTLARARKVTDTFSKGDRKKGIQDAVEALTDFNREARRAKVLAGINLKIVGKEQAIAIRDALKGIREQLTGKLSEALDKFKDKWETTVGALRDAANEAALDAFDKETENQVANGSAAQKLRELQAEADRIAAEAEDAANQKELDDATAAGDEARKAEAQARIAETARQRAITEQQAIAEGERQSIEARRATERKALEAQQVVDRKALYDLDLANEQQKWATSLNLQQTTLKSMLDAEYDQLQARTQNYARFANDVKKILKAAGLSGLDLTGDVEQVLEKAKPKKPAPPRGNAKARAIATSNTLSTNVVPNEFRFYLDGKEIDVRVESKIDERDRDTARTVSGGVG